MSSGEIIINKDILMDNKNSFNQCKSKFESSAYNTFKSSYLCTCYDEYILALKLKLDDKYQKIQKGYQSIINWWNDYFAEVDNNENTVGSKKDGVNIVELFAKPLFKTLEFNPYFGILLRGGTSIATLPKRMNNQEQNKKNSDKIIASLDNAVKTIIAAANSSDSSSGSLNVLYNNTQLNNVGDYVKIDTSKKEERETVWTLLKKLKNGEINLDQFLQGYVHSRFTRFDRIQESRDKLFGVDDNAIGDEFLEAPRKKVAEEEAQRKKQHKETMASINEAIKTIITTANSFEQNSGISESFNGSSSSSDDYSNSSSTSSNIDSTVTNSQNINKVEESASDKANVNNNIQDNISDNINNTDETNSDITGENDQNTISDDASNSSNDSSNISDDINDTNGNKGNITDEKDQNTVGNDGLNSPDDNGNISGEIDNINDNNSSSNDIGNGTFEEDTLKQKIEKVLKDYNSEHPNELPSSLNYDEFKDIIRELKEIGLTEDEVAETMIEIIRAKYY